MKYIEVEESFRAYVWECGYSLTIENVVGVHISESGSHRVVDSSEVNWYIPSNYKYFKFKGKIVA